MMIKQNISYLEPDNIWPRWMQSASVLVTPQWHQLIVFKLGFFTDNFLKNAHHVNKLVSQLFYTLAGIARICDKLDFESAKTIVKALVLSKLDYCNSLLAGSAQYQLDRLQHIERMAWREVCHSRRLSMSQIPWNPYTGLRYRNA